MHRRQKLEKKEDRVSIYRPAQIFISVKFYLILVRTNNLLHAYSKRDSRFIFSLWPPRRSQEYLLRPLQRSPEFYSTENTKTWCFKIENTPKWMDEFENFETRKI